MDRHTSFRIGGKAAIYLVPSDENELAAAVREYPGAVIVGGGANLLVSDEGLPAVITTVKLNTAKWHAFDGESYVTAGAGCSLTGLARESRRIGLSGLEFAFGIPGTAGGAVVMNAGTADGEVKNILESVRLLLDGAFQTVPASRLGLSYRSSSLPAGAVVVAAKFMLRQGTPEEIGNRMKRSAAERRTKQPLDRPSAGCVFRNPPGDFAGRIIDRLGLKGMRVGDAQVSEKHANFIVNLGRAKASQVAELIEKVERTVFEKTGIRLEREVRMVGNF